MSGDGPAKAAPLLRWWCVAIACVLVLAGCGRGSSFDIDDPVGAISSADVVLPWDIEARLGEQSEVVTRAFLR